MEFRALILAVWLVSFPLAGYAQEASPEVNVNADQTHIAKAGFEEGAKAYLEGRYQDAIVTWSNAYEVWPAAIIPYNQSLAAAKLGNFKQALIYAQAARKPGELPLDANYSAKLEGNISAWQGLVKAERIAGQIKARKPAEIALDWRGYTGIGAMVVGSGLIVGALLMGASASSDIDALGGLQTKAEHDAAVDDIESTQTTAQVLLFSGIGIAATGVGLLVWDLWFDSDTQISMGVTPNSAAVTLGGSW